MQSHQPALANNNAVSEQVLTPKQIYLAAIGMFDAAGFTCQLVVTGHHPLFEYARVFEKNNKRHILYYPGVDGSSSPRGGELSELDIVERANPVICLHLHLPESKLEEFYKHYLVMDSKVRDHFIYGYTDPKYLVAIDTLPYYQIPRMPYDDFGLDRLHPTATRKLIKHSSSIKIKPIWQSGHFLLEELSLKINKPLVFDETKVFGSVDSEMAARHAQFIERGQQWVEQRDQAPYHEGYINNKKLVYRTPKFNYSFPKVMKSILAGFTIALVAAALVALAVYTLGGIPALFAAAAFVGGACGLTGVGSIVFGIGLPVGITMAAYTAFYSIKQYFNARKRFQGSHPKVLVEESRPDALNSHVMQELGVTPETLNQVGGACDASDLPPPPPYTADMLATAAQFNKPDTEGREKLNLTK